MTEQNGRISGSAERWQVDRRQVLRLSAMTVAIPSALAAPALARAASQPTPAFLAVADKRWAMSAAFADAMRPHANEVLDVAGGLTPLWQNVLVPHWQLAGSVVCGLTTPAVWNGLREQARSAGRRAFRITVHDEPDGAYDAASEVRQLVIAAYASTPPAQYALRLQTSRAELLDKSPSIDRLPALVSWIIR
ncbi:hypothetical protein [Novosphingobium sp.]|uniref:hypothetical protein n=1 Tax=Novosphingobium sp. TaxID=1874826 RepID=UPI003564900A